METESIIELLSGYDIVGLGEATHGQKLITEWRIKIIKSMIKDFKYNVFVLEEDYYLCKMINDYISDKRSDIKKLSSNFMFPWRSNEMLGLIKWMKKFNKNNKNRLKFFGLDCQKFDKKYLDENDSEKQVEIRDKCMFDIFNKIYNKKSKYILYFHNAHLQKKKVILGKPVKFLGYYLKDKYKKKYFVVGNSFYYGTYSGKNIDNNYKLDKVKIIKSIIKVENNKKLEQGFNIINKNDKVIFIGGAVISKKNPLEYFTKINVLNNYDAIMIINNEKALDII